MKTTSFLFYSILMVLTPLITFSQNEYIKVDLQSTISQSLLEKSIFTNNNDLLTLINKELDSVVNLDIKAFKHIDLTQKAIIIIKHQFNYASDNVTITGEDITKDDIIFLHKDKTIRGDSNWSEYLLNTKDILLIFIGGEADLQNATIKIVKEKSFFDQSFNDFVTLAGNVGGGLSIVASPPVLPIRYVLLKPEKLNSPCTIQISHVNKEDPLKVKVHEKNFFAFHVGVSANQFNKNQVKLQNQQLAVSLDSTQKKDWTSNLVAMITFYPFGGRDIDRFEPFYKPGLKGRTVAYQLYNLTFERIGIFGGVRLSKDPIQNLYLGVSYAFAKNFNFNFGTTWANNLTPSITNVGNINSVQDALKYADRKYERQLFIGISFAPSAIGEILGVNKDKK